MKIAPPLPKPNLDFFHTIEIVAEKCQVTSADIFGTRRTQEIAYARHIAVWIAKKIWNYSDSHLGRIFLKDHGTIIHSIKRVQEIMEAYPDHREFIQGLEGEIRNATAN